jgi:hypothetical protein
MDFEWGCNALLCRKQSRQVGIDFADLSVGARGCYAIASCGAGCAAHEVVTLIGSENEERVPGVDPVTGQPAEECREGTVIRLKRCYVTRFAGAIGRAALVFVMRV